MTENFLMTLTANFPEAKAQEEALAKINTIANYAKGQATANEVLNGLTPQMLTTKVKEANDSTPLWWLIYAATQDNLDNLVFNRVEALNRVITQFGDHLALADFLNAKSSAPNKTGLWLLTLACVRCAYNPFIWFWNKWQNELTLAHFLALDGEDVSPLFLLAKSAMDIEGIFNQFWQKWDRSAKEIVFTQLRAKVKGLEAGKSIQWFLLRTAIHSPFLRPILEEVLAHAPDAFSDDDMQEKPQDGPSMQDLLQSAADQKWSNKIENWIAKRNAFFKLIRTSRRLERSDYEEIKVKPKAAYEAGFIEAPYYLGQFLEERIPEIGKVDACLSAFALVPNKSWHFVNANERATVVCLREANIARLASERRAYLIKALEFTLKIPQEEHILQRCSLLDQIAACEISEGQTILFDDLPPALFQINSTEAIPLFFTICEQIRDSKKLAHRVAELERWIDFMGITPTEPPANNILPFAFAHFPATPLTPQYTAVLAASAATSQAASSEAPLQDKASPYPGSREQALR